MPPDPRRVEIADRVRIQHMLDAARQGVTFCVGRGRSDLEADQMFRRAPLHAIQEIGEAASRVSEGSRERVPGLPWTKIVGMRHLMVHTYWSVNLDLVWEVGLRDLPELIERLEAATAGWPMPTGE